MGQVVAREPRVVLQAELETVTAPVKMLVNNRANSSKRRRNSRRAISIG